MLIRADTATNRTAQIRAWPPGRTGLTTRSSSAEGLHVIGYRGTLDVPRELAPVRCEAAVGKLRRRGTPRGSRALSCFWQAVVGLRWFRDRTAPDALARDHGISRPPRASASSSSMLDAPTGSTSLVSSAADAVASASDLIDAYRLIVSRRSWAAASGCSPMASRRPRCAW